MSARLSISLVEDNADIREIWCRWLGQQPGFAFLKDFSDAESALAHHLPLLATPEQLPAILLVDWHLGEGRMSGIELIRQLQPLLPHTRCLLLTAYDLEHLPAEAIRSGAAGFLYKSDPLATLGEHIRAAHAGQHPISDLAVQKLFATLRTEGAAGTATGQEYHLCPRETEVLRLLASGKTAKETADALHLTPDTVATYRKNAFKKLGVHKLPEAMRKLQAPGKTW